MPLIQLYIAATIDGFIAREDGSLDWLLEMPNPNQIDYGYNDFISEVDSVIMGRKTYDQVMGFSLDWPYGNCRTYIITNDKDYKVKTTNTHVLNDINIETIHYLRSESKKNIWLVGGGNLITQFLNESAIDEMILSIIPVILGRGIKLFPNGPKETKFELIKSKPFETGVVNLTYRKK